MTQSMTGFGAAEGADRGVQVRVELKSLNSKGFEVTFRLPRSYFAEELWLKNRLQERLGRGKIGCNVSVSSTSAAVEGGGLDTALLRGYHVQLAALAATMGLPTPSLEALIGLPGVVQEASSSVSVEEWGLVKAVTDRAVDALVESRRQEGATLAGELHSLAKRIAHTADTIAPLEAERSAATRQRLQTQLLASGSSLPAEDPRFAQELVYYLERADITEERVRLAAHLALFQATLVGPEEAIGRKLGFIAQEMGREINTLGAKAYHAQIQSLVVEMKDELEKIKEQVSNLV